MNTDELKKKVGTKLVLKAMLDGGPEALGVYHVVNDVGDSDSAEWDGHQWRYTDAAPEYLCHTPYTPGVVAWFAPLPDSLAARLQASELQVLDHLAAAWNEFLGLDIVQVETRAEFRRHLSALHGIIARRVAYRVNPEVWNRP